MARLAVIATDKDRLLRRRSNTDPSHNFIESGNADRVVAMTSTDSLLFCIDSNRVYYLNPESGGWRSTGGFLSDSGLDEDERVVAIASEDNKLYLATNHNRLMSRSNKPEGPFTLTCWHSQ